MTIAIDIRCLMNPNYSGVAQYTYNLLENIFKIDPQNRYKLFYNSNRDISVNLPRFDYSNVKFHGFKYPNKLLNSSFLFLNQPQIDTMLSGCDLFFLPNPNFGAWTKQTPKAMTVHDLSFELYPRFFSAKQRLWHKFIRPRNLAKQCEKIITDSDSTKNDLTKLYQIPTEKIKVIYPGLNHELYRPLDKTEPEFQQIKEKYNLPDKYMLYLGTIEPRKNIEGIIEAFNLIKSQNSDLEDLNLVIAGAKGWKYERVFQAAADSPFESQIKFIGYVAENHKPQLYNLAELFIFPSFYEGFGLPALEAQACGVPVIAGLNSSFPEVLADSAFLVNPDNLNEIAKAISEIILNPEIKQSLITKGLNNCQRFSWQTCAQETLDYLIS